MCMSFEDLRHEWESTIMDSLCTRCRRKVVRKLTGSGKTLFEIPKEEYGFCEACIRTIDKAERQICEDIGLNPDEVLRK